MVLFGANNCNEEGKNRQEIEIEKERILKELEMELAGTFQKQRESI